MLAEIELEAKVTVEISDLHQPMMMAERLSNQFASKDAAGDLTELTGG